MSDYFIFDDIDTRNYEGIYVYFDEVDFTPKRVGEFVEIPNRNGEFFLDGGRYEDVTHTYDVIAMSMENGRDLINALASKVGHFRLQDSFNPNEFYSAVFDTEVEPTVTMERDKITFKVMFTRKPQRFLTSGETASTVANNGTLTNPTLFESRPMLEVTGYGDIGINGETITIENAPLGETKISNGSTNSSVTLNTANVNTGDRIYKKKSTEPVIEITFKCRYSGLAMYLRDDVEDAYVTLRPSTNNSFVLTVCPIMDSFYKGTDATITVNVPLYITYTGGSYTSAVMSVSLKYTASTETVTISISTSSFPSTTDVPRTYARQFPEFFADSTKTALPQPLYIDLDIGEAYGTLNNEPLSFNNLVTMPAKLPTLKTGTNTFTKSNTVTQLKVTPRWWKI